MKTRKQRTWAHSSFLQASPPGYFCAGLSRMCRVRTSSSPSKDFPDSPASGTSLFFQTSWLAPDLRVFLLEHCRLHNSTYLCLSQMDRVQQIGGVRYNRHKQKMKRREPGGRSRSVSGGWGRRIAGCIHFLALGPACTSMFTFTEHLSSKEMTSSVHRRRRVT